MKQGLGALRVVDLSTGIPGGYCARLLADAGADVVKVEPPDGDPLRTWAIAAVINRYLPHIPIFNAIILHPPNTDSDEDGPKLRPGIGGLDDSSPYADLYGLSGTAQSVLRPAGKARIGDRLVNVISNGPYIPAGAPVEVIEVTGNRVVVREVV